MSENVNSGGKINPVDRLAVEILTSSIAGTGHSRLAGCAVALQAHLNLIMLHSKGKGTITEDEWISMAEEIMDHEERLQEVWESLNSRKSVFSGGEDLLRRKDLRLLGRTLGELCEVTKKYIAQFGGDPQDAFRSGISEW
jgi:hypothetical protein